MNPPYYEPSDLDDFPHIGEYAPEAGEKFFEYYNTATGAGKLTEREKSLIALAVATVRHCPYCIDAFTNKCLSRWPIQRRCERSSRRKKCRPWSNSTHQRRTARLLNTFVNAALIH
ncbi:MAG: carboxymuconolactone decarboxylase family protein [Planctomycetota bacterium]|jgi:hypothetical protein